MIRGVRHLLREFTATAVKEHLRAQVEDTDGPPKLTRKEVELVRFVGQGRFVWDAFLTDRPPSG